MTTTTKSVTQTYRDIASVLGGPMRTVVVPLLVSAGVVRLAVKPFQNDFPLLLIWSTGIGAALLLAVLVRLVLAPLTGKLILRDIERDFGPKTRKHVLDKFAAAQDGDRIELDIPAVAHLYREGK